MIVGGKLFQTGDIVRCKINGRSVVGKIYVQDIAHGFICQDEISGSASPDLLGFSRSWAFSNYGEFLSDNVTELNHSVPANKKENINISADMLRFFEINNILDTHFLLSNKIGVFDDFNKFEISKTEGLIDITSNKGKKVSLKFGRFVRQLINRGNEINRISKNIDADVERLSNSYVSFQNSDSIGYEFISGEDILKAYSGENYVSLPVSTLHKSCMTNRPQWLKLYTENPNQVSLVIVKFGDKIASRALVWTTPDGKKFLDRVYYSSDWLEDFVIGKMKEIGIESIYKPNGDASKNGLSIKLDNWIFDNYPYLDTFYKFDKNAGTLHNLTSLNCRVNNYLNLRSTNG